MGKAQNDYVDSEISMLIEKTLWHIVIRSLKDFERSAISRDQVMK